MSISKRQKKGSTNNSNSFEHKVFAHNEVVNYRSNPIPGNCTNYILSNSFFVIQWVSYHDSVNNECDEGGQHE